MKYYAIYDDVAKECGPLFSAKNDGIASRNFASVLNDDKVPDGIKSHLHLKCVLDFDAETGVCVPNNYDVVLTTEGDEVL